jgi:hypothetical protein
MGTNFYTLQDKHIGKRSALKGGTSFAWAINPDELLDHAYIKDEYGDAYSVRKFLDILDECPIRSFNLIGEDFS